MSQILDFDTVTKEELLFLPSIGESKANKFLAFREQYYLSYYWNVQGLVNYKINTVVNKL
jgi:hypothetical protein